MRKLYLLVAGLLGVAAGVLPAVAASDAPSNSASFTAIDDAWQANGGTANAATIAPGGTVTFSYPTGMSMHNADFGTGSQPTSCTPTTGPNTGSVPPLPNQPTAPSWSGSCTFNTPGTYTFHCDLHALMTGTIVVGSGGTTTTTTSTTSPSPGGTTSTSTTSTTTNSAPGGPGSSSAFPPAGGASVKHVQHGTRIDGSVKVTAAGAGGRLEVDLFANLGRRKPVGRLVRRGLTQGNVTFAVSLNAAARRALHRHHRLTVTVVIAVRSPSGNQSTSTRQVKLLS